jgi:dynactin-4
LPRTSTAAAPSSPGHSGASSAAAGGTHYLSCGVCRWESLEIGLKFERPTGLASKNGDV